MTCPLTDPLTFIHIKLVVISVEVVEFLIYYYLVIFKFSTNKYKYLLYNT